MIPEAPLPTSPAIAPRRIRRRRRLVRDLGFVLVALATGLVALGGYTTYRIMQVGRHDGRRPADAIVVLGAAQFNGAPSRVLAARLDHAIELYRDGYARYLVVTGGKLPGDITTEADTSRAYAVARGVPASAILAETTGRTTLESLRNVRSIMAARGLSSAVFVSDRTHMLRVLLMAGDLGIDASGSPTDTSPTDTDPGLTAWSISHELGALALYALMEEPQPEPTLAALPPAAVPAPAAENRGPAPGLGSPAAASPATSPGPPIGAPDDEPSAIATTTASAAAAASAAGTTPAVTPTPTDEATASASAEPVPVPEPVPTPTATPSPADSPTPSPTPSLEPASTPAPPGDLPTPGAMTPPPDYALAPPRPRSAPPVRIWRELTRSVNARPGGGPGKSAD